MAKPDLPEFNASTLPLPQQWKGQWIWRPDLGVMQYSTGTAWVDPSSVSGAGIAYAALSTTTGTPGEKRTLSDGPDAGAQIVWSIPEGSTSYAWCWAIYPLASYL